MSEESSSEDQSLDEVNQIVKQYEDSIAKNDIFIQDKELQSGQQFNYLQSIYQPNSTNLIVYRNFTANNKVMFLDQEKQDHLYYQTINENLLSRKTRIKEQDNLLNNRSLRGISQKLLRSINYQDEQQQKMQEDFLSNQMTVIQIDQLKSLLILKNNKLNNIELYVIKQLQEKIDFKLKQSFDIFKDIYLIKGIDSFQIDNKNVIVFEYFTEVNFYQLDGPNQDMKYTLKHIFKFEQKNCTIRKTNFNRDSQCFFILLHEDSSQFSQFFVLDKNFNVKNKVDCPTSIIRFQCIGIHNQVIFSNHKQVNMFSDLEKTKDLLKYEQDAKGYQIVYQAFNFDSFKIFGVVTSDYFQFYDYRFPNTSIHSLQHGQEVPPDNCVYSNIHQNDFFSINWSSLDINKQIEAINLQQNYQNQNKKMFLFSLKQNGQICTIPHIKYPDKKDIINPLAYNVIKEINQATLKNNKFSLLLEHQCFPRQLYTSSLFYKQQQIEGFQVLQIQNNFLSILKEKNGVISLQQFQQNQNKILEFKKFQQKTYLFQQNNNYQGMKESCLNNRKRKVFKTQKKVPKYPKIQFPFKNDFLDKLKQKWSDQTQQLKSEQLIFQKCKIQKRYK